MTLHVTLSLDLSNIENQRYYFNAYMGTNGWEKLNEVDTVWHKTYNYAQSRDSEVAADIKSILKVAAQKFEPDSIEYIAQIGNEYPIKAAWVNSRTGLDFHSR